MSDAWADGARSASERMHDAQLALHLTLPDLWCHYLALGGSRSLADIGAYLLQEQPLPAMQHDYLAQALNDHFVERGLDHPMLYSDELHRLADTPSSS